MRTDTKEFNIQFAYTKKVALTHSLIIIATVT